MNSSIIVAAAAALMFSGVANAAEIKVLSTQATEEAYRELVPLFEKASGHKVTTIFTGTLDLQKRIAAGEAYDLIIMAGPAIDDFIKSGKIVPGSRGSGFTVLAAIATLAPSRAARSAMASPMPRLAPVTNRVLLPRLMASPRLPRAL